MPPPLILRGIHIVFSIPILGYVYSPFEQIPNYAPAARFVFVPVLVLSGFGCGKATSFDDSFRKDRPNKMLQITLAGGRLTAHRHLTSRNISA